ncbi:MAG: hypothetical protein LC721_10955 [Actinobacteria bacterium]|nr:hypothetical protein [Actinomycetota bacterium]
MEREPVPSAIVARLLEAAKELEEWAVEHRQATLAEHEQGVLSIFRRVMGPALGAVLERALGLDHPAARRQRAPVQSVASVAGHTSGGTGSR